MIGKELHVLRTEAGVSNECRYDRLSSNEVRLCVSPQGSEAVIIAVNNMTLLIKRQGDGRETRP